MPCAWPSKFSTGRPARSGSRPVSPVVFKAVGGKAVVLKLPFDMAIAGDDAPVPVYERPEAKRIEAEVDPYKALELFAHGVVQRAARMAPI